MNIFFSRLGGGGKQGPVSPLLGGPLAPTLASVTAGQQQPATFSAKEFPKLGAGGASSTTNNNSSAANTFQDPSLRYGPGPSLRPQSQSTPNSVEPGKKKKKKKKKNSVEGNLKLLVGLYSL